MAISIDSKWTDAGKVLALKTDFLAVLYNLKTIYEDFYQSANQKWDDDGNANLDEPAMGLFSGFVWNIRLDFTDNSANYSVEPIITGHEMVVGIRNASTGNVTVCRSTTAKTGSIGGVAADTTYYVHAAPSSGDFTITINTTSTESGDDLIIGVYRTEKSAAEIAHSELYAPLHQDDAETEYYVTSMATQNASGAIEISGCPFQPKHVWVWARRAADNERPSVGWSDGTSHRAFNVGIKHYVSDSYCLYVYCETDNIMVATAALNNDGCTLTFTETGDCNVEYSCMFGR